MKSIIIPILAVAGLFTSCGAQKAPKQASRLADEFSGDHFYYLTAEDRVKILTDLRDMVLDNYVLLSIKSSLGIVTEPQTLFDDAMTRESQIDASSLTDPLDQARSNLRFIERAEIIIASFKDTHFSGRPVVAAPQILNGITLARVGADVRVIAKIPQVIAYDASHAAVPADYAKITLGSKVVSIDGQPVNDAAAALRPLMSASTPEFGDSRSVMALAQRSVSYPENSFADWEFAVEGAQEHVLVRLPYFYAPAADQRPDALYFLKTKGFQKIDDLKLTWDDATASWNYSHALPVEGYSSTEIPQGMVGATTWVSVDKDKNGVVSGATSMRTGYMMRSGKAYGVIQLFEFVSEKVALKADAPEAQQKAYKDPVVSFVKDLKAAGLPLILDLRVNGGGNPLNSVSVLEAVAKTGETYPPSVRALRVTRIIRQMIESGALDQIPPVGHYDYDYTTVVELRKAIADHREYTSAFTLTDDIKASPDVGGYDQKMVALVTPFCISACDGMSTLLNTAKRATIIGTHTNGTGAGFIGSGPFEELVWQDRYKVMNLRIPNRLFGPGGSVGTHVYDTPTAYADMNSENRPTVADVTYDWAIGDYTGKGQGWYQKAMDTLDQP